MTDAEFEAAFELHKDAVYRFAWRMLPSPAAADDVVQDTFLALLRHQDRFDPARGSLRAFLLGIARNLACKRWRDDRRWDGLDEEQFVALPLDIERAELGEIVARAVRSLPPLQREVVILAEYEDLSLAEIARAVGAEVGTVKSRLHRGRDNLRRMLAWLRMAMKPLDDRELSRLLREWKAPDAPASLRRPARPEPWWRWFVTGTVRVPVPVGVALAALAAAVWMYAPASREPAVEPQQSVNQPVVSLADFQPVAEVELRVIGAVK